MLASLLPADADKKRFLRVLGIHGNPVKTKQLLSEAKRTDGCFYPPAPNPNHVAGPREKALMDFWETEESQIRGLESRFKALLADLDKAAGDICSQTVAVIGKDADTMFGVSPILDGLHTARNMARESFKNALSLVRQHRKMSTSLAAAMGK